MLELNKLTQSKVFYYFEEISKIPHGSGNCGKIADFCVEFAKENGLDFYRDEADNVIIYKGGAAGYEKSEPVILQGHLDMVCQKTSDSKINFDTDAIELYIDEGFIKAKNTTLGADDGIGVAIILAILADNCAQHPPIEAVFTTDEEIGMLGAAKLDMSKLSAKMMINLDHLSYSQATVSCAGGVDVKIYLDYKKIIACGKKYIINIDGLLGGHSGCMIHNGRVNANILAGRILTTAKKISEFDIVSINGGDKGNAITPRCKIEVVTAKKDFYAQMEKIFDSIKEEMSDREEKLELTIKAAEEGNFEVLDKETCDRLINMLLTIPDGVVDMSKTIDGLVETSLNMGILKTQPDKIMMLSTLRSNKQSGLDWLREKLFAIAEYNGCVVEASGHYPPWEYVKSSKLQTIYAETYEGKYNSKPGFIALHAGLECGIFCGKIKDLDCISIGPDTSDVHTVFERLNIDSTNEFFDFLMLILSELK